MLTPEEIVKQAIGGTSIPQLIEQIRAYGDACAAAERERCAVVAEGYQDMIDEARVKAGYANSPQIAAAIRTAPPTTPDPR